MLKLKLRYFGHLMRRADSFEKTLLLGMIEGRRRRWQTEDEMVGWHHQLNGHKWVNSGSWWWTGRPGVLQFTGSQRVRDEWGTGLNWTPTNTKKLFPRGICSFLFEFPNCRAYLISKSVCTVLSDPRKMRKYACFPNSLLVFFTYSYSACQCLPKAPERYSHPSCRLPGGKHMFILYFGGDTNLYQTNSSYVSYFLIFPFILF